jgi:arylsulfatase A-like enzyme
VPKGTYLADWLTDRAVDFLRRHKDKPFFLYLPHFGVHSPHEAKEEIIARFKNKPAAGGHHSPVYAAMIASVDESVGRLMATLKELKLDEKTLVIFSADNGGVGGYAAAGVGKANSITDNAPLRGGKGMLYEGGVRVAFIARWPGVIAAGKTSSTPVISVDLYPTLLDVAGVSPPKDHTLDGVSILPVLKSDGQAKLDRPLFWHFPGYLGAGMNSWRTTPAGAIRRGDWKLLEFFEDGRLELYNLASDLGQKRDLATAEPQRVKALHDELVAWRKAIKAPVPTPNKAVAARRSR